MLDLKFIRENKELIKQNSKNRLSGIDVDNFFELDAEKRKMEAEIDELRAKRNRVSKTKPGPEESAEMKKLGETLKTMEEKYNSVYAKFDELLHQIPNLTHPDVHVSQDEDDNPVLETFGKKPKFKFKPLDHAELAEKLDLVDFDRATKVSGAKFYYFKNELVLLELDSIRFKYSYETRFYAVYNSRFSEKRSLRRLRL